MDEPGRINGRASCAVDSEKVFKYSIHPSDGFFTRVPRIEMESAVSAPLATTRGVTRVLILADAPVLRRGLLSMINETAGLQAVGTPGEARRALTLAETARPDAVVVELGSGRAETLNACRDLRRRFPQVAIVALASSEDAAVVNEALAAGVREIGRASCRE